MKNKNTYLKIVLTVIVVLLGLNLLINSNIFNNKLFAVTQTSEFQDMFKFIMGPKSNIRGNLMVLEYPGNGIYYINLDNIDNFFEGKDYIEFVLGSKKFKLPKLIFDKEDEGTDGEGDSSTDDTGDDTGEGNSNNSNNTGDNNGDGGNSSDDTGNDSEGGNSNEGDGGD